MNFSADDKHLIKFVSCLCFQAYFLTSKSVKFFALKPACLSTCECAARHGKEFCWPLTSRSAFGQWCEMINLVHAASTRRGGSLHAYGYQSDLTKHARLKWNGFKWSRVPNGILYWNFRVVLAKHEVWPSHVDWRRMCQRRFSKTKIWHRKCAVFRLALCHMHLGFLLLRWPLKWFND